MVRPLRAQISKMWASARRKAKMWASARRIHKGREALNAQAFSRALPIEPAIQQAPWAPYFVRDFETVWATCRRRFDRDDGAFEHDILLCLLIALSVADTTFNRDERDAVRRTLLPTDAAIPHRACGVNLRARVLCL
jgi:hypothetical protein